MYVVSDGINRRNLIKNSMASDLVVQNNVAITKKSKTTWLVI
jgi:hypothetical protein